MSNIATVVDPSMFTVTLLGLNAYVASVGVNTYPLPTGNPTNAKYPSEVVVAVAVGWPPPVRVIVTPARPLVDWTTPVTVVAPAVYARKFSPVRSPPSTVTFTDTGRNFLPASVGVTV